MKRRCKLLYLGLYYSLGWTTFNSGSTGDSNRLGARVTGRCAQSMEHAQPQLAALLNSVMVTSSVRNDTTHTDDSLKPSNGCTTT
jgi:hypothetical protein